MVKEINTVQDLINELKKFPLEMEVRDYCFDKIEEVKIKTWTHDNYPYNLPDKDYVCLESVSYTHLTLPTICSV